MKLHLLERGKENAAHVFARWGSSAVPLVEQYRVFEGCVMAEIIETSAKPREEFLYAAQQELVGFERRERELRKKLKRERAAELPMPLIKQALLRN
jgi:hypothetical protein